MLTLLHFDTAISNFKLNIYDVQVLDIEDDEFDQTDSNDIHMNRSREIVHIMGKISSNCEKRETTNCCCKLLDIFSMYPDIKDHLVTHFGVTPILEMFEATQTCHQGVRDCYVAFI